MPWYSSAYHHSSLRAPHELENGIDWVSDDCFLLLAGALYGGLWMVSRYSVCLEEMLTCSPGLVDMFAMLAGQSDLYPMQILPLLPRRVSWRYPSKRAKLFGVRVNIKSPRVPDRMC